MAATAYLCPMSSSAPTSSTQQTRPALRRATYVHVSDLTSAYNIDHARLEQELSRVKNERTKLGDSVTTASSSSKKPDEDDSGEGTAADLETVMPQKRLQPPRGGFNLCVLVGKVNIVVDKKRVDQSRVRLAEVEIGDETGSVSLRARDEQIDMLEEVSQRSGAVVLRNCTLELYQGKHIRLAVTKWGKLSTYPDSVASTPPPPSKMNADRNFSLIDLSLVASEMADINDQGDSPYSSRPGKRSDPDPSGYGSGTSKQSSSKSGHSTPKHQQSQSSKRSSRSGERRQSRGKTPPSASMNVHYGGIKPDTMQQPHPGQVIYHAMPGFAAYDQSMGMRQFPHAYAHASRQDITAQQIMMQQQQYDIQQRQLHHMYGQEAQRQDHQMQQATQMMIRNMGSFDTTSNSHAGGIPDQHQVPLMTGANPLLVPMGMPPGASMGHSSQEQYPSPSIESHSTAQEGSNSAQRQSGAVSPFPHSMGKMNPDASSYTPTYLSAVQGHTLEQPQHRQPEQPQQHTQVNAPGQFTYDMAHGQGVIYPPYPGFYSTASAAAPPTVAYTASSTESNATAVDSSVKGRPVPATASPGTTGSSASGKENVTSKT